MVTLLSWENGDDIKGCLISGGEISSVLWTQNIMNSNLNEVIELLCWGVNWSEDTQ